MWHRVLVVGFSVFMLSCSGYTQTQGRSSKLCITAATYTCWYSEDTLDPLTDSPDISQTVERRRIKEDIDLGTDYMKRKNYRGAVARYCDALSRSPQNAAVMVRVAQALEKSGDTARALTFYSRSLELYPAGILAGEAKQGMRRIKAHPAKPETEVADQMGCPSEAFYRGAADLPDRR